MLVMLSGYFSICHDPHVGARFPVRDELRGHLLGGDLDPLHLLWHRWLPPPLGR